MKKKKHTNEENLVNFNKVCEILYLNKKYEDALKAANYSLEIDAQQYETCFIKARFLYYMKKIMEAIAACEAALLFNPNQPKNYPLYDDRICLSLSVGEKSGKILSSLRRRKIWTHYF